MSAIWDGDTGTVTVTAKDATGAIINLGATTARHLIVRNRGTDVTTELTIASSDLTNGIVVGTATSLGAGTYDVILRVTDPTNGTVTIPSADVDPPHLVVRADIDAP